METNLCELVPCGYMPIFQDIIDLDTLEQLEKDFLADEQTSSGDSPDRILSPPYKGSCFVNFNINVRFF